MSQRTVHRTCQYCGVAFLATPDNVARGWGQYCSIRHSVRARSPRVERQCTRCGKVFAVRASIAQRKGGGTYCSRQCQWPTTTTLRPGVRLTEQGYAAVRGRRPATGSRLEHRVVVARILGRPLPRKAVIHHVNGDRTDNRPQNLVVCENAGSHNLLHMRTRIRAAGGNPNTDVLCCRCGLAKPHEECSLSRSRQTGHQTSGRVCMAQRDTYRRRPSGPDTVGSLETD